MCGFCYLSDATAAGEASVLVGGPIAYAAYRKARRMLGLPDTAVAPVPPKSREPVVREPANTARPGVAPPLVGAPA